MQFINQTDAIDTKYGRSSDQRDGDQSPMFALNGTMKRNNKIDQKVLSCMKLITDFIYH